MGDPHGSSRSELQQCIAELEEIFKDLADVNEGVSKAGLQTIHQMKRLLFESRSAGTQMNVRRMARLMCRELLAEAVKLLIETLIRFHSYLISGSNDVRVNDQGSETFGWTNTGGTRGQGRNFDLLLVAA